MNQHAATAEASIAIDVPMHWAGPLKELLKDHPRLKLISQGWVIRKAVIFGPPADIESFRPRLEQWQKDCNDSDAW